MEPVAAMFGIMAALPQCIQSAKELYDLRSRYKDASILITAIYSESMVIAASLSQVQNLLQHDALQSKPQLLETFDRALTGCRVVYGCLDEEVRDLVAKANDEDLRFKDKAKFLWKEDTFKELLTQIRGQQSALSLLIQGLQMESIADIRLLVENNSVTLDQVVKRSRTLRQTHPRIEVPESIFSTHSQSEDATDADSIIKCTEFAFDDEVINSKAYRKAMAMYTAKSQGMEPIEPQHDVAEDESTALGTIRSFPNETVKLGQRSSDSVMVAVDEVAQLSTSESLAEKPAENSNHDHDDLFDSLERDILSFMPKTGASLYASCTATNSQSHLPGQLGPVLLRSRSNGDQLDAFDDLAPPLPPRRPSDITIGLAKTSLESSDESIDSSGSPSIFSKLSTTPSNLTCESSHPPLEFSGQPLRKQMQVTHEFPHISVRANCGSSSSVVQLEDVRMHKLWVSILEAERQFNDRMTKFRKMFYDNIIREWPVLEKHLEAILIGDQLSNMHRDLLLQSLESSLSINEMSLCSPVIFENWAKKVHKLYREYSQRMPHAISSIHTTQTMDSKFTPFVNTLGLSIAYFGMSWQEYLKLPYMQLRIYVDNLQGLLQLAISIDGPAAERESRHLKGAIQAVTWLRSVTSGILDHAQHREDVQNLEKRIYTLNADFLSQLQLLSPTRKLIAQGSMAIKLKGQGLWTAVHVVLLDNYLLWGKMKTQKKGAGDKLIVIDAPIPTNDLDTGLPYDSNQSQKATMFDEVPRGSVLYIIRVKNKSSEDKPHLLGASSPQERKIFYDHLVSATLK